MDVRMNCLAALNKLKTPIAYGLARSLGFMNRKTMIDDKNMYE